MKRKNDLDFEESLSGNWGKDSEILEIPLTNKTLIYLGVAVFFVGILVASRLFFLMTKAQTYEDRALVNLMQSEELPAPRGLIYDRYGKVLAENEASFSVFMDTKNFLDQSYSDDSAFDALRDIVGLEKDQVWDLIRKADLSQRSGKILVADDLSQSQVIKLKGLNLPSLSFGEGFKRIYNKGKVFSSLIGYTGFVDADDLRNDESLSNQAVIGRSGLEAFYDKKLRGESGSIDQVRNAKGEFLGDPQTKPAQIGKSLKLTIDAEFQEYFFNRFGEGLRALGRTIGVGLAVNPKNGEVLALFNFPAFDNNLLSSSGHNDEKTALLLSKDKPLFNRAVSGFYNPGSTIKPLVGIAAIKESVVTPEKEIFSPGYLEIPNPYEPDKPTRYLDWRYQGNVDLSSALAQSSNVYFYTVGGGFGDVRGLGISRLREWWSKFNLGNLTGIDMPGEGMGFLPDPEWKKNKTGRDWLLGDTFNVSIGQGDLLVTPIQLLTYISGIAAGGKIYQPFIDSDFNQPKLLKDLSDLGPQIKEAVRGMEEAVTSPMGTAKLLDSLPFSVAAKTGSAQVKSNTQENAFFVGYAPVNDSEIAILVLIENSREGSLNAVPIAKDALSWYYENRIKP